MPSRLARLLPMLLLAGCASPTALCLPAGQWVRPGQSEIIIDPLPANANRAVVLLGEHHDSAADHRWQLAAIQALYAANARLSIGFEMFPRSVQPVLDAWTAGRLEEREFLIQVDWAHVWGQDPELYLPIFRFARDHSLPMIALNVGRELPRLVSKIGWSAVPVAERQGIGDPAPATAEYSTWFAEALGGHGGTMNMAYFIDAQLVWDRAMAEGIVSAAKDMPDRLVVALMGSGHLERRLGVPRQLAAMGQADVSVFLPVEQAERCEKIPADLADALFVTGG